MSVQADGSLDVKSVCSNVRLDPLRRSRETPCPRNRQSNDSTSSVAELQQLHGLLGAYEAD